MGFPVKDGFCYTQAMEVDLCLRAPREQDLLHPSWLGLHSKFCVAVFQTHTRKGKLFMALLDRVLWLEIGEDVWKI